MVDQIQQITNIQYSDQRRNSLTASNYLDDKPANMMAETIEENCIEEEREKKIQPFDSPSGPSGSSHEGGTGSSKDEKKIRSRSEPTSSRASNNSLIGSQIKEKNGYYSENIEVDEAI